MICGIKWRQLWNDGIFKFGDSGKTMTVPLSRMEQLILMRYIEAETVEKDFIGRGLSNKFTREIFLHFYFACHGCSDQTQKILLNEREIDKIFWEAELNIKNLLQAAGSNVKAIVIYDCCREPFDKLKAKIEKTLAKIPA